MGQLVELGRRVQLLSMDPFCHDITVGLYEDRDATGPYYVLHSYSRHPDAAARLGFLARAMAALGGMAPAAAGPRSVRWTCGAEHLAATKRLFTEAVKLSRPDQLRPRPAEALEPRSGATWRLEPLGAGRCRVTAAGAGDMGVRPRAVAQGFAKLAAVEVEEEEGSPPVIRFPCGHDHGALAALLLPRALNVRAAMREEESAATRGILVAPSAQAQAS